jgi:ParB family chromosome partitioning protein
MADVQKPKSRLGRGLSSLISISSPVEAEVAQPAPAVPAAGPTATDTPPAVATMSATPGIRPTELPLEVINPQPASARRQFDDAHLAELAASMKTNGVIQPIVVRQVGDSYQLIAGERRFRAAKLAGLNTIPTLVRDVDSFTQAQMALVENIQREDLNRSIEPKGYRTLLDQLGLTQAELASRLGEDRSSIANFLRLLELSPVVQDLVREGRLSTGHAKLLAGVQDRAEQERLANLVVAQELSVRNLERLLSGAPTAPQPPKSTPASAHVLDLEKSLARQLGCACRSAR